LKPVKILVHYLKYRVTVSKFKGVFCVEKISRLVSEVAELCQRENVPLLCIYGKSGNIEVKEFAPEDTPEIYGKARSVLFNSTKPKMRSMKIEG
jgi:hypothetical protein